MPSKTPEKSGRTARAASDERPDKLATNKTSPDIAGPDKAGPDKASPDKPSEADNASGPDKPAPARWVIRAPSDATPPPDAPTEQPRTDSPNADSPNADSPTDEKTNLRFRGEIRIGKAGQLPQHKSPEGKESPGALEASASPPAESRIPAPVEPAMSPSDAPDNGPESEPAEEVPAPEIPEPQIARRQPVLAVRVGDQPGAKVESEAAPANPGASSAPKTQLGLPQPATGLTEFIQFGPRLELGSSSSVKGAEQPVDRRVDPVAGGPDAAHAQPAREPNGGGLRVATSEASSFVRVANRIRRRAEFRGKRTEALDRETLNLLLGLSRLGRNPAETETPREVAQSQPDGPQQ